MKKRLLFIITAILGFQTYAQIAYEEGYFINNSDQQIDCLIKNRDWKNNPTRFDYKLTEEGETKTVTLKEAKEFGITNTLKYVRKKVEIDRSSSITNSLTYDPNPVFKEEELFLRVLVEGKANLYLYEAGNLQRYFYDIEGQNTKQLIHKAYRVSSTEVAENNTFRDQVWNDLKCPAVKANTVLNLKYTKNALVKLFERYNECSGEDYVNYQKKQKRDFFHLTITPGISSSSLSIKNRRTENRNTDFGNKMTFRIGAEAEFVMPFNKNKWAVVLEPNYQYYKVSVQGSNQGIKADYSSIEIPVGLRYYLFLNENSKIFINGFYVYDIVSGSKIDFEYSNDIEINNASNWAVGVGYKYNNKYSIEFRYYTNRDVLQKYFYWESEFKSISVILGYTLF